MSVNLTLSLLCLCMMITPSSLRIFFFNIFSIIELKLISLNGGSKKIKSNKFCLSSILSKKFTQLSLITSEFSEQFKLEILLVNIL